MTLQGFLSAILPSLTVALFMAFYNRKQSRKSEKERADEAIREEGEKVRLDLLLANSMLSYAIAMAYKRGAPNGEIETGIKQYESAIAAFHAFERKLVTRND